MVHQLRSRALTPYNTRNRGAVPKTMRVVIPSSNDSYEGVNCEGSSSFVLSKSSTGGVAGSESVVCSEEASVVEVAPEVAKKTSKYTVDDAVDFVLNRGLTVPEALRATLNVCTRQNLYQKLRRKRKLLRSSPSIPAVGSEIRVDSSSAGNISPVTNSISESQSVTTSSKRRRKSSKDKNHELIEKKKIRKKSTQDMMKHFVRRYHCICMHVKLRWRSKQIKTILRSKSI